MVPGCKTLGKWLVIATMMSAFGGHWLVLQSVAWTSMVFDNVKHATLCQALERTFDGEHPCALCKSIEKGRQSEKQRDVQAEVGKINFFYQTSVVVLVSPRKLFELRVRDSFALYRPQRPILQPPREALA